MSTAIVTNITHNARAEALEQLFEEHYQLVYRTAYSLTGSVHDAEDVLQTLFLRLLARENPPDLTQDPEPYLYRAAFNLSMDVLQSRRRQVLTDDIESFDKSKTGGAIPSPRDEEDIDARLHRAIAELQPAAAQIIVLRYIHNKSQAEIAKIMRTTRSTVAVSLFRSRARLKRLLQPPIKEKP
jgi:RNA polymerase sigma factor (sigma-70 family)